MHELLSTLGVPGIFASIVLLFGAVVVFYHYQLRADAAEKNQNDLTSVLVKKLDKADIGKYRTLFSYTGMAFSLLIVLSAFEYPMYSEIGIIDLTDNREIAPDTTIMPITEMIPKPPVLVNPEIIEIDEDPEIKIDLVLTTEISEDDIIEEISTPTFVEDRKEVTVEPDIVDVAEVPAEPANGMAAFLKYVAQNIKYPRQAARMGVEGKVYIQFVIEKDGSFTDIKAIRGIGAGCDEEAVRVLSNSPKWKPAKQRGRTVRQRMVIPINFRLN